jgi:hypothetical protein
MLDASEAAKLVGEEDSVRVLVQGLPEERACEVRAELNRQFASQGCSLTADFESVRDYESTLVIRPVGGPNAVPTASYRVRITGSQFALESVLDEIGATFARLLREEGNLIANSEPVPNWCDPF